MSKKIVHLVFAVFAFVVGCGGQVTVENIYNTTIVSDGAGGAGGDEGILTATTSATATASSTVVTATTSVGGGGSGGEAGSGGAGGGSECIVDDDCSHYDTECYVFWCLSEACLGHERDDDGDGYSSCGGGEPGSFDCADQDPSIHPDAAETCNDAVDSDCNGADNNGCAAYCDPWMNGQVFGYNGCCGTYVTESTPAVGELYKVEGDVFTHVYYQASNGKRYVFPTTTVLDSWYAAPDVNGVPPITPSLCELVHQYPLDVVAAITIGGNVTIRPGTYVTGIIEDPKRYVVAPGAVLRPLLPEFIGDSIYPGTYQERIHMTPDAFFVNYFMGAPVTDVSDYDLDAALARTLEQELGLAP